MRIVDDPEADARYVYLSERRPARTVEVAEGTIVDLDRDGRLIGIELICLHRAWAADLEQILAGHAVEAADAAELRALAAV